MAPKSNKKDLTADQVKMIVEVVKRSQTSVTPKDWDEISDIIGATNGRAAKERFRYLMVQLKDNDDDDGAATKKTATPKKRAAEGTNSGSAKKIKKAEAKEIEAEDEDGDDGEDA